MAPSTTAIATTSVIQGPPSSRLRRIGGASTAALRDRSRSIRSAPEPALARGVFREGEVEVVGAEVGPQGLRDDELRVGRLPDQEVGQAMLAAGSNDEVRIRKVGRVELLGEGRFVDRIRADPGPDDRPDGIDE